MKLSRNSLIRDYSTIRTMIISQIIFVDAEEEAATALRNELPATAYKDEVIIIIADDNDKCPRRLILH